MPGHDVDLVDLDLARQFYRRRPGGQPAAELLRNGLHFGTIQTQFQGDLPVGKVQAHEVKAQHPHAQRLVVPGQHRSGEVVEAPSVCLAPVALPTGLRVVVAVPGDGAAAAHGAARTLRPAVLAHQREALGVVDQARKVDQVGCGHDKSSSRELVSYSRLRSRTRCSQSNFPVLASPPRNPTRASALSAAYQIKCSA
jgi:hypothetical protein